MTDVLAARAPADGALDVDALQDLLSSSFHVVVGTPRVVRRARLDTFDGRLARAGRRLQHVTETADERLELADGDETVVARLPERAPAWPAMAADLPDGPVRDDVSRWAGVRALMVVDEGRRLVRRAELRNADHKIVVRLVVDEPADRASTEPATVVVRPLRGYAKDADRAWRLVTSVLEPAADPLLPGSARPTPLLVEPVAPAAALLAAELAAFSAEIRANLPGAVADIDTEFLHDLRVAVRRTRSVLKLGREVLPADWRTTWEPQFKWLGDLTTPVRDLDVYQLGLPDMVGWLVAARPGDLEPFETHLARRRTAARRSLLRGLRGRRLRRLLDEWDEAVAARAAAAAPGTRPSAGELCRAELTRAHRRVVRGGASIGPSSPADNLHLLRKRCKELRYALEVFAPVVDADDVAKAVSDLKGLQDVLGRFQDSEVQRTTLRTYADEMLADGADAATLLAMGELVGHLDAEQQRARGEFDRAFARYVRPAGDRRMRRLYVDGGGRG